MNFKWFQNVSKATAIAILGFELLLMPVALAHPHVFIDYDLKLRQQNGHLQGFDLVWTLDSENTDLILAEFDTNHNGQLESNEAAGAAELMLQDMSDYNFFTEVQLNGQDLPIKQVQQLDVRVEQKRIIYRLFLPCALEPSSKSGLLSFKLIDPDNYIAFKPQFATESAPTFRVLQTAQRNMDAWIFELGGT